MRNSFIYPFVISLAIVFITFILCYFDAYAFDEGTITTNAAKVKHQIVGYITLIGIFLGNNFFANSMLFSAILLPFSMIIDALLLTVIFMGLKIVVHKIIKGLY